MAKRYRRDDGVLSAESDWLTGRYMVFWTSSTGAIYREHWFKGSDTEHEAQQAIDEYARKNRYPEVEE